MSTARDEVILEIDDRDLGHARLGWLRRDRVGGSSNLSFEFDPEWIAKSPTLVLDPSLPIFEGEQFPPRLPGLLDDTAPDRWGRTLLTRREAAAARSEGRAIRRLDDWDYLVGVSDQLRMGGLRLLDSDGQYLSNDPWSVPPTARLGQLQHYAARAERGERLSRSEEEKEIAQLIAPGSSLGGARPKSNYVADDGSLWIAKFPSRNDLRDWGAWEAVLNQLAARAGIVVPPNDLLALLEGHRTFAAQRFDRTALGKRRLFASAMTLTAKQDHEQASYLEIADAMVRFGNPNREALEADLAQLFRRVAFNVLTAHRDDHLRNHAFLMTAGGWRLSPAYDLNPVPELTHHTLAIDESDTAPDISLVMATSRYYRLSQVEAGAILEEVREAVRSWRQVAASLGIDKDEVDAMAEAFYRD